MFFEKAIEITCMTANAAIAFQTIGAALSACARSFLNPEDTDAQIKKINASGKVVARIIVIQGKPGSEIAK